MSSLIPVTTTTSSYGWTPVPPPLVAPVNAAGNPLKPSNIHLVRGPLPAEAIESNANRTFRTTKEELFKKLNSSNAKTRNRYRAEYEKIYGTKWENARNTVRNLFTASQNAKKRQRWEAEKKFRNNEWFTYSNKYVAASLAQSLPPGVPRMGHPPRLVNGYDPYVPYTIPRYGGKGTRKRNSRKSSTTRKNKKNTKRRN